MILLVCRLPSVSLYYVNPIDAFIKCGTSLLPVNTNLKQKVKCDKNNDHVKINIIGTWYLKISTIFELAEQKGRNTLISVQNYTS